jgi:DNA invertase Pin-like site-specific DNA recombinase
MIRDQDFTNTKFNAYNRKSSEQDERQALSLGSQIDEAKRLADIYEIHLQDPEDIMSESKSAKEAYNRPVFENLIKKIERGEVQGIITWHEDRLSRNAIDAARLVDLFDKGKLKVIITPQHVVKNTPESKFMLVFTCGQAKMENDNKGINVMRGLVKKREMGYPAGVQKIGYKSDGGEKGYRKIIADPERFGLVKQIFEMMLTGKYSAGELYTVAVEKIGLTTIQRKREGGKPIKKSQFYTMLKDPFYAGFFMGKNKENNIIRYEAHPSIPRMVTEAEHYKIISIIRKGGSPKAWVYLNEFPYKRFSKCGHCGGSVTAEKKVQMICKYCKYKFSLQNRTHCPKCNKKTEGKIFEYIYYHCTLKKDVSCPGGSVSDTGIREKIEEEIINQVAMSPALREWCVSSIDELEQRECKKEKEVNQNWYQTLADLENQKNRAVEGYSKGIIKDHELARIRTTIEGETARVRTKIGIPEEYKLNTKRLERKLDILEELKDILENGTCDEKIEAMLTIGSNLTIKEKTVSVTKDILYESIQKGLMEAKAKNPRFEPKSIQDTSGQNEVFVDVRPTLLRG